MSTIDLAQLAPVLRFRLPEGVTLEDLAALPDLVNQLQARVAQLEALQAAHTVQAPATLLTVQDAATALGMSDGAVRAAIARGTIPSVKVGRRVRVPASAIPGRG